jgi:predicted ATPase
LSTYSVYDRGPIDVLAYLNFKNIEIPKNLVSTSKKINYDYIFILRPWKEIYINDSERYETFEQSLYIDKSLQQTYESFNLSLTEIPKISTKERIKFIKKVVGYE